MLNIFRARKIFINLLVAQVFITQWQSKPVTVDGLPSPDILLDSDDRPFPDRNSKTDDSSVSESNSKTDYSASSSDSSAATPPKVQICRKDELHSNQMHSIALGAPTFQTLIEESRYWSDKSGLIAELLGYSNYVNIIICPKKSGKSMNLNMISTFVEIPHDEYGRELPLNSSFAYKYFATGTVTIKGVDVKIIPAPIVSNKKDFIKRHLGQHPVIYLSFANLKLDNDLNDLKRIIRDLFSKHEYVLKMYKNKKRGYISEHPIDQYRRILNSNIDKYELHGSLKFLCEELYKYYKVMPMIFIDEYDNFIIQLILQQDNDENLNTRELLKDYLSFMNLSFMNNEYLRKLFAIGTIETTDPYNYHCWLDYARFFHVIKPNEINEFFGFATNEVEELLLLAKNSNFTPNWEEFSRKSYSLKEVANYYGGYPAHGNQDFSTFSSSSVASFINYATLSPYWNDSSTMNNFWTLFRFDKFERLISEIYDGNEIYTETNYMRDTHRPWEDLDDLRVLVHNASIYEKFSYQNEKTVEFLLFSMGYLTPKTNRFESDITAHIPNTEIREILFTKWSEFILVPTIKKTIQNIGCSESDQANIIHRVRSFIDSIRKSTDPIQLDYLRGKLKLSLIYSTPEDIEKCVDEIAKILQRKDRKESTFRKYSDIGTAILKYYKCFTYTVFGNSAFLEC